MKVFSPALLLFGSGMCALVYEIAWFRQLRLVFGASTSANGAVLAVFIGGLGLGGLVLGRRVDRDPEPLVLYARWEAVVALSAAATPILLAIARGAYIALGGALALGTLGASIARLMLTAIVLGVPTFMMGGTLPAAARALGAESDARRATVGLLYGLNTLGAVVGCLAANFYLLEALGIRQTLWLAALVNLVVAAAAFVWSRTRAFAPIAPGASPPSGAAARGLRRAVRASPSAPTVAAPTAPTVAAPSGVADSATGGPPSEPLVSAGFVVAASAIVGFAFFLMELVWYRLLGPLLGGTIFTFGLILAVALLGIGLGGACYAVVAKKLPATLGTLAATVFLEAAFLMVPYALGDWVALLAAALRPAVWFQLGGMLAAWSVVTMLVVFPAAFVSGMQLPLLVALLGKGRDRIGAQTGLVYAANTAGAIAGALAGGFGLLPALSLLGCWRMVGWLLVGLGVAAGFSLARRRGALLAAAAALIAAYAVGMLLRAEGPTAFFRHSPIGIGKIPVEATLSRNGARSWMNAERRSIHWERDGVESTIALNGRLGWSFVVNGKIDGHVRLDAATQVMLGLVGAMVHPSVKHAMVIGLGTGSTAGWLGVLPDIERVDVAELEPAVLHVAEVAAPVNRDVLANPHVSILIGDARETLLTTHEHYDLIASEPSNPHRAGVASLFTREFFQASSDRLAEGGLFLQWVQGYSIDAETMRTIYATMGTVFGEIETWELGANDLVLVASRQPVHYDLRQIRERVGQEPYRSALAAAWRATSVEGFFAHYIGRGTLARALAQSLGGEVNTDDKNVIEFGFARNARDLQLGSIVDVRDAARARGEDRPRLLETRLDWERVEDEWMAFRASENAEIRLHDRMSEERRARGVAMIAFLEGRAANAVAKWRSQSRAPSGPTELVILADASAQLGDEAALTYAEALRPFQPVEANAVVGRFRLEQRRFAEAAKALSAAFIGYRQDPWPWPMIMQHALDAAKMLAALDPGSIPTLRAALAEPFAAHLLDEPRLDTLLTFARGRPLDATCADALAPFEPYFPWQAEMMTWRMQCYDLVQHAEAARAHRELEQLAADRPLSFGSGLAPAGH